MWAILGSALTARRGPAVIITVIALLAGAAVAAAPWYAVAAHQRVGVAAVDGAPVDDRLIVASWRPTTGTTMETDPGQDIRATFSPDGFTSVSGAMATAEIRADGAATELDVAYRENACDHLGVTGDCPREAGDVLLPAPVANGLSVEVGDELRIGYDEESEPIDGRLVGTYQVIDPGEPYWGAGDLVGVDDEGGEERQTAFTAASTLVAEHATYNHDLIAQPAAFATTDMSQLQADLDDGLAQLRGEGYSVTTGGLTTLLDRIVRDRQNVTAGVGVGVAILVLLTWFTLVVVLREVVVLVRSDVGWWRLHGAPSGRGWIAVVGQSAVPLVVGAVLGGLAGMAIGAWMGSDIDGGAGQTALWMGWSLVAVTVVGGLVAVVGAQLGTLRTPVRDLLRRVPARRGRWRRSMVDLVLIVLAAAAVGQALVVGPDAQGLPLLAPGLAVLALALIAAWVVPPLVAWLADRALHGGRLGVALIAASMARRPGTHRLFALIVVSVALATTAFMGWDTSARTQEQRAALETGAHRVVTVAAPDTAQLLATVREIDPDGTEAMAVVHRPGVGDSPAVLALDSTAISVVDTWREEYGGTAEEVGAMLRPSAPDPAMVRDGQVTVAAAASDPAADPVYLRLRLRTSHSGEPVEAVVGPLGEQLEDYPADVPACADGCRLVGVQPVGEPLAESEGAGHAPANAGAEVTVRTDVGPADWRPALGPRDLGPVVGTAGDSEIRLTVSNDEGDGPLERDDWLFVADTPAPIPAVLAGWRVDPSDELRLAPLAGAAVPAEHAATASLVPVYGEAGALVDLEYAERLVPFALEGGTAQVWLSPDAPDSIVAELREAGLPPLRVEAREDQLERLGAEGSAVGIRFQAAVALVGIILTAGAVLVHATRERPGQAAELAALRAQGVSDRAVRVVGYGGLASVVAGAIVLGVAAGLAGTAISRLLDPGFVDGWDILPTAAPHPLGVGVAALVAVVVLGGAALTAAAALVRQTRGIRRTRERRA